MSVMRRSAAEFNEIALTARPLGRSPKTLEVIQLRYFDSYEEFLANGLLPDVLDVVAPLLLNSLEMLLLEANRSEETHARSFITLFEFLATRTDVLCSKQLVDQLLLTKRLLSDSTQEVEILEIEAQKLQQLQQLHKQIVQRISSWKTLSVPAKDFSIEFGLSPVLLNECATVQKLLTAKIAQLKKTPTLSQS